MSSSSNYRLGAQFVADKGNIDLVADSWVRNLNRIGESGGRLNGQMSLWQRQMQAFATTIRYAIAGGTIYGVLGTIQDLNQFQRGMGDIAAIFDTTQNKVSSLRKELGALGDDLIEISNRTITPLDQIQQAVVQIESSVPKYSRQSLAGVANVLAQTSATTQGTDIQELVGALVGGARGAGFSLAEDKQVASTQKLGDWFYRVIKTSIGMTGPQFVSQAGRLLQTMPSANLKGEGGLNQLGYYASLATFLGGSPASNERAMAQLLQTIRTPTGAHQKAFAAIGLSPQRMSQMTAPEIIDIILKRVAPGLKVNTNLLKNMPEEDWTNDSSVNAGFTGPGAQLLMKLIGRAESRRMIALMAATAGSPDAMQLRKDFQLPLGFGEVQTAMKQRADQMALAQAATETHNAILQLGRDFENLINPIARTEGAIADFATRHKTLTTVGIGAVGATAAGVMLGKMLEGTALATSLGRIPGLGKIGGLIKGMGGIGRGAVTTALTAEALPQLISGGTGIAPNGAGSRSNPLWVIIHPDSQYFIDLGGSPNDPKKHTGAKAVEDAVKSVAAKAGGAGGALTLARGAGIGLGAAASAVTLAALIGWYSTLGPHQQVGAFIPNHLFAGRLHHLSGFSNRAAFARMPMLAHLEQYGGNVTPDLRAVLTGVDQHMISMATAEKFLEQMAKGKGNVNVKGEATVHVKLEPTDEARRLIKIADENKVAGVTLAPDSRPSVGGKAVATKHRNSK